MACVAREFVPYPEVQAAADPIWVRGYRLFDLPGRCGAHEGWLAADALREATHFANIAREAEKNSSDWMKPVRTWMLTYTFSDYCLEGDTPGAPPPHDPRPDAVQCGELHLESIVQLGRLLPGRAPLCCSLREADAFLRSDGSKLRPERFQLWRNLLDDIHRSQCSFLMLPPETCTSIALVVGLRPPRTRTRRAIPRAASHAPLCVYLLATA